MSKFSVGDIVKNKYGDLRIIIDIVDDAYWVIEKNDLIWVFHPTSAAKGVNYMDQHWVKTHDVALPDDLIKLIDEFRAQFSNFLFKINIEIELVWKSLT